MPMTIALIGYRGTGKTTIAQLLARQLGLDWVDADVEVEFRAGKSIAAIFEDSGEQTFRDLESRVIVDLCQREQVIIAFGGGAILREENRSAIAACHHTIWLTASAETLATRIYGDPTTADRRPNLTNQGGLSEIKQMLATREPIYRACATLKVDTEGREPAAIVNEIVAGIAASQT